MFDCFKRKDSTSIAVISSTPKLYIHHYTPYTGKNYLMTMDRNYENNHISPPHAYYCIIPFQKASTIFLIQYYYRLIK
jgi:hypothetical protein